MLPHKTRVLQIAGGAQAEGLVDVWPLSEGGGGAAYDFAQQYNGTLHGGVTVTDGPYGLPALRFNGTSGYVSTGATAAFAIGRQASISFWFRTSANYSATSAMLVSGLNQPTFPRYFQILFGFVSGNSAANQVLFILNQSTFYPIASTGPALNDGKWHHVACGTGIQPAVWVSIDGHARQWSAGQSDFAGATAPVFIAASNNNATPQSFFNGDMADVRSYNRDIYFDGTYQQIYSDPLGLARAGGVIRRAAMATSGGAAQQARAMVLA